MSLYSEEDIQELADTSFNLSAKEILGKIKKVRDNKKLLKKRWFWELLQNAADSIGKNEKVSVLVEIFKPEDISNSYLKFSHNGRPFRRKDAKNLIFPYSDKSDEEDSDKSGQFGTGFLSTHFLSERILVKGIFCEKSKFYNFSFSLDRSGETKPVIAKSVQDSWKEFKEKRTENQNYSHSQLNYDTNFIYYPKEEVWDIISDEFEEIFTVLKYVLLFEPKIEQVKFINTMEQWTRIFSIDWEKEEKVTNQINKVMVVEHSLPLDSYNISEFLKCGDDKVEIALSVNTVNNNLFIKPFRKNQPHFFCPFPIVSLENYKYPVVVNSRSFVPVEDRSSLILTSTGDGPHNRTLIKKTIPLFEKLLAHIHINPYQKNYYLLSSLKESNCIPDMDVSEFNELIRSPLRNIALETSLVDTPTGERLAINSESSTIYFGKHSESEKRKEFWKFIKSLHPKQVPAEADIDGWHKVIWDDCPSYTVKEFTEKIASFKRVDTLSQKLGMGKEETLKWLNRYVNFVAEEDNTLLNVPETAILPNQYGEFKKVEDLFLDDETIDDELKSIIADIAQVKTDFRDVRRELLDNEIYLKLSREKGVSDLGPRITSIIQEFLKHDEKPHKVKNILSKLLNWLRENKEHAQKHFKGIKEDALLYNVMDESRLQHVTSILSHDRSGEIKLEELSALTREKLDLLNDPAISAKLALVEQLYEDEKEERKQFQFKKQIGDKFEKAFRLIFDNDSSFTIQKVEGEEDFILRRNGTDEEYYVELKSIALGESSVLMTDKQAKKAVHASGNYCLCIIPNRGEEIDTEYIKTHALFDLEIGKKLADKVSKLRCLEEGEYGISVKFDEEFLSRYHRHKYKFEIDRSIWGGLNLSAFKQVIAKVEKLEDSPF